MLYGVASSWRQIQSPTSLQQVLKLNCLTSYSLGYKQGIKAEVISKRQTAEAFTAQRPAVQTNSNFTTDKAKGQHSHCEPLQVSPALPQQVFAFTDASCPSPSLHPCCTTTRPSTLPSRISTAAQV